jgi:FkbM family methyltransferase
MLRLQAGLNDVEGRLLVVEACAGDTDGQIGMLDTGVIGAGYFVPSDGRIEADVATVASVTIDQLASSTGVEPTHLKIDVEGAELAVFDGARDVISGLRPFICLELHNAIIRQAGGDPRAVIGRLEVHRYRLDDVETGPGLGDRTFERDVSRLLAWPETP